MKIAVYAIAKDESAFVQSFCDSASDADLILIADTGSTDDTASLARECGALVQDICISPWRFDRARDAALALLPRDVDVCISLDLDETLEPGWRAEVERCFAEGVTRLHYRYDWGSGVVFHSDKIHTRHGYHWHHPCHESLRADGRIVERTATTDQLLVTHHPDPTKSRGQYLSLLAMSVAEDPACPRNAFYYARELTFYRQHENAIAALITYLANPKATWASERAAAMRLLGESHGHLGQGLAAVRWCRLACAESPGDLEPWVSLAGALHNQKDWTGCYAACLSGLQVSNAPKTFLCDPSAWAKLHDLAALAAYQLGRQSEALVYGQQALALAPNDARLIDNLNWYAAALEALA